MLKSNTCGYRETDRWIEYIVCRPASAAVSMSGSSVHVVVIPELVINLYNLIELIDRTKTTTQQLFYGIICRINFSLTVGPPAVG